MPDSAPARISALGDAALLVLLQDAAPLPADAATAAGRVARAAAAIADLELRGVLDVVPAPGSLLVRFDPASADPATLEQAVRNALQPSALTAARSRAPRRIRVVYGGESGPDLDEVARRTGRAPEEVVALHSSVPYTVLATGFAPGFIYLGPLPEPLRLPRRERPRAAVAAGSVAIAANQSGVYGVAGAGGWWIIGRTARRTFDPRRNPPVLLTQGDRVRFVPA